MINRRRIIGALGACGLASGFAFGQTDWPVKPVKFVVPFPPGGSTDPIARMVAAKLSESLGQPFVVENKPGASGSIGTAAVAKAPADGYTYVFVFDTHAVNPALIANLPFDTARDLAPVMLIGTAPMAIATPVNRPFKHFADVVAAARAKPDSVTFGTVGNGSLAHLSMTLLQQHSGIKMVHVPYKGGGPLVQDAIGGQLDLAVASVAVIINGVKSGKLRPLAVMGERRSKLFAGVPTLAEQGVANAPAQAWWAIFAPVGVPAPILAKLHDALIRAFQAPDVRNQLTEQLGMELLTSTPQGLQQWLADEMTRWGKVVKENAIRPD